MSLIRQIPDNSRIRFPQVRFTGAFGGVFYDFTVPGNENKSLMELEKNSIYLIERFDFKVSTAESNWLEGQRAESDFPFFRLRVTEQNANNVYSLPIRCMYYRENAEHLIYFRPFQDGQELLCSFQGRVDQVPGTVGEPELNAFIGFNIYQIWDRDWIKDFENERCDKFEMRQSLRVPRSAG